MSHPLYIGLMCGTSLDAIDVALLATEPEIKLLAAADYAFPGDLRNDLMALCLDGDQEIERLGRADRQLAATLAGAVNDFLQKQGLKAEHITAIGSHGQTIRHRPHDGQRSAADSFTLQIGDPNTIAELTGITTVADFRRRDIAAGGQGAPLVPAFHSAAFAAPGRDRVVANIGGMANISILCGDGSVSGFDTGPGNVLMDSWIQRCRKLRYDRNGNWAASGKANPDLVALLLADPYYRLLPPKSTGREHFSLASIDHLLRQFSDLAPQHIQASLLELTARSLCEAITEASLDSAEVFLCGGGAANRQLVSRIEALLPDSLVSSSSRLGIAPDWVEAAAFAWLAQQTLDHRPGNVAAVTGARGPRILGGIYPA